MSSAILTGSNGNESIIIISHAAGPPQTLPQPNVYLYFYETRVVMLQ